MIFLLIFLIVLLLPLWSPWGLLKFAPSPHASKLEAFWAMHLGKRVPR